jgi:hypothetical protein
MADWLDPEYLLSASIWVLHCLLSPLIWPVLTAIDSHAIRYETPMVSRIQDRVALMTRLPVLHQEDMQVLRYGKDQYYHKHTDSLPGDTAGPRVATILVFLSANLKLFVF